MKRVVILGASRGLGKSLANKLSSQNKDISLYLSSRNVENLHALSSRLECDSKVIVCDYSKLENLEGLIVTLEEFEPTHIFYVAGGGPFGKFKNQNWASHMWAINLNFLFPAKLIYEIQNQKSFNNLSDFIYVGSAVAENTNEYNGPTYGASKIALKSLIQNIEPKDSRVRFSVYSPGYLDTEMLPQNAWPRQSGLVSNLDECTEDLIQWSFQEDKSRYRTWGNWMTNE